MTFLKSYFEHFQKSNAGIYLYPPMVICPTLKNSHSGPLSTMHVTLATDWWERTPRGPVRALVSSAPGREHQHHVRVSRHGHPRNCTHSSRFVMTWYSDGLMQESRNSSELAMELRLFCFNQPICGERHLRAMAATRLFSQQCLQASIE